MSEHQGQPSDTESLQEKYEFADSTNKYLNGTIKFSDAKAGAISAACAVSSGFLTKIGTTVVEIKNVECLGILTYIFLSISIISTVFAFMTALLSILPRQLSFASSLYCFPDIANTKPDEYIRSISSTNKGGLLEHILKQNYNLSIILKYKFTWQTKSVQLLLISIPSTIIAAALSVFL